MTEDIVPCSRCLYGDVESYFCHAPILGHWSIGDGCGIRTIDAQLKKDNGATAPAVAMAGGGAEMIVNVRWWDGYLEMFEAVEVRFGCDLLWLKLKDSNRHIPLRHVRWFSLSQESHEVRS